MADAIAFLVDPLSSRIVVRALLACALVAVAAGLLGCVLLVRRLSLLGDAIGHAVLPGIGLAWLIAGTGIGGLLVGGLAAGLIAVIAAVVATRTTRLKEDAAFAAVFAVCSALGIILVSRAATPIDLLHVLYGNLLAVDRPTLLVAAGTSVAVVTAFALLWRPILLACFDPGFQRAGGGTGLMQLVLLALVALTLLAALRVVGAVLALGLFLLPAASAWLWCERWGRMLALAVGIGLAGAFVGVIASWHLRLPPGPCVVCALGVIFAAALATARRR